MFASAATSSTKNPQSFSSMHQIVAKIEDWMMTLPKSVFDAQRGGVSTHYVLQNLPISDAQRDCLTPGDIEAAIADSGLQSRLCSEAGEVP